jgi:SAM-dependent methyltransferase
MTLTSDTQTDARPAAICWACGGPTAQDESWRPVQLHRCPACGLLFTPERTPEALQELYAEGYFDAYPGAGDYLEDPAQRRYEAQRRLAFMRRHGATRGRLLEIGAAGGQFLLEARAQGFQTLGVEPDEALAREVAERTGLEMLGGFVETVDLPDTGFDAVCLWHVLEHLSEPLPALERLRRALSPGGGLFIEVPNIASVFAQRERASWVKLDIEHHVAHYTPKALGTMLERAGFEVELVQSVSMRDYLDLRRSLRPLELAAALREFALVRSGPRSPHPSRHELLRAVARKPR